MPTLIRTVLLGAVIVVAGCSSDAPLYCDTDTPCTAGLAYCDLQGVCPASEGHANTCIPEPCWDGGPLVDAGDAVDARIADAAPTSDAPENDSDATVQCSPQIAFHSTREDQGVFKGQIYVMNPDGSGQSNVSGGNAVANLNTQPAWNSSGKIVYGCDFDICTVNADGTGRQNLTETAQQFEGGPQWSPDGAQIVYMRTNSTSTTDNIWVMNADGSNPQQLTSSNEDELPSWSPDGTRIAFRSFRDGNYEVYVMDADGTDETNLTQDSGEDCLFDVPQWSPDSSQILVTSDRTVNLDYDVYVIPSGGGAAVALPNQAGNDVFPRWSSDGSRIAWIHDSDVWVMNSDGSAQFNVTNSPENEDEVEWVGDQLIYQGYTGAGDQDLYLVNIDGSGEVRLTSAVGDDNQAAYTACVPE